MRRYSPLLALAIVAVAFFFCFPSRAAKKAEYGISSFAKYVEIPGAKPVGSDTCSTCHAEVANSFRHAFHAQQGVQCEECHGAGSLHVEGGGDISKIISFSHRTATDANGVCLSCHAKDARLRNWIAGPHASNAVRCTECHQTHAYGAKSASSKEASFNLMTPGRVAAVEDLVPEAKVMMQPRWQVNDACLRCHETQRGQMSLPYHHPLREGKMSCGDCHDPHGGPSGNNLRIANTNQLCLGCHAQYRGPYAYQHPPVTENCLICHSAHGSPNTNLLSVSEPALCLQCHAGHHNGAGLPLADRCTNCHGSIHGTDVPTPSGGSRFIDKGPADPVLRAQFGPGAAIVSAHPAMAASSMVQPISSHASTYAAGYAAGAAGGALGMMSAGNVAPLSGGNVDGADQTPAEMQTENSYGAYSITPGSYRFIDKTGFGGRVGEYDSLQQSAGADAESTYVSTTNHLTVISRGNVISGEDYQAGSQITAGEWGRFGFDIRSFVQQQDNYPFYAFPVLDIPPGTTTPLDTTTDLIPAHTPLAVTRRLGKAYGQVKVPNWPVHLFVKGDWQARVGVTQFAYLDENTFVPGVPQFCGQQCHFQSQVQPLNYTTRNISGGADVDLGPVRLTYQHTFSSFNDRLVFPNATFTGPFTPETEGISVVNPPPFGPPPRDFPAGNYPIDIPSPSQASSDQVSLNWTASAKLTFNGNVDYTRLTDTFTNYPQNAFNTDETLTWLPISHLRVTGDYHQQNLLNNFTPYYSMFGNVSYHGHWEGARADYELPKNFDVEAYYRRSSITRSNAILWPQVYSIDNTDLQRVIPSSFSNTTGLALRYHDRGNWSARAGYEWAGTHNPGYLVVPGSNNRVFADVTLTPWKELTFNNDLSIIVQNAFPAIPLPNTPGAAPGFGGDISGLPPYFQRRNRFYIDTASATFRPVPDWTLGLGYSYQQNNLNTYMAFQNDSSVNYVVDEPLVPYKQISQTYWGESSYTIKQRLGLNLRVTYNSARSGFRPDLNPNDAALFGNQTLISSNAFDPVGFSAALGNLAFSSTQISQVIVPEWVGQSKAYYLFPRKFEGGLIFYYGSYRDYWNPILNGVLRTFNVYVGRSW
ncbi:MAG TPA: cytochrome c3 family protein [Terriglobales bacterium]|nr:cytochrome c3 family protein [Terriglobales bacterium]